MPFSPRSSSPHSRERSEEHTSELQSQSNLVCRLLLEKKHLRDAPLVKQIAVIYPIEVELALVLPCAPFQITVAAQIAGCHNLTLPSFQTLSADGRIL